MKKFLSLLMIFVFTVALCGCEDKKSKEEEPKNEPTIEDLVKDSTKEEQNGIVLSDIKISELGATNKVTGKAKNVKNSERNITLTLKMYNSSTNKLLGRATIDVDNIKYNEERNFELNIMGDYSNVDKFEVTVTER